MVEADMRAIYNEIEPYACDWLENLIEAGHIEPGIVDRRRIEEIEPDDVREAQQFHTFAGIGVWSYALRLAGWPPDRTVWTGSCPCQPFSAAGKQLGAEDARHLWPTWFELIRECRPPFVFGEQVSSAPGLDWFGSVSADLESAGYAVTGADLPAASVGAPHRRQRLFFFGMADANGWRAERVDENDKGSPHRESSQIRPYKLGMADSERERIRDARPATVDRAERGRQDQASEGRIRPDTGERDRDVSAWHPVQWLRCSDGKARPTQPGLRPLADGTPSRVGRLRAYGNAIVPQVAAVFIRAAIEAIEEIRG
tara:strand:- start:2573 stop:3511 length:939 start_codon:yes stop_codon:yes gene_type:complete